MFLGSRCLLVLVLPLQLCFSVTVGMLVILGTGVLVCCEVFCMLMGSYRLAVILADAQLKIAVL